MTAAGDGSPIGAGAGGALYSNSYGKFTGFQRSSAGGVCAGNGVRGMGETVHGGSPRGDGDSLSLILPRKAPPQPGEAVGRFRVVAPPRPGTFSTECVADDPETGRTVVVRLLPEILLAAGGDAVRGVLEEARSAAAVNDPRVLRLLKVGRDGGDIYIATEDFPGSVSAGEMVADGRQLPVREATRLVREAAAALEVVHAAGLVHRDVRPENILRGPDGTVRLAGLGLTRAIEEHQELTRGLTFASPNWCSPEWYRDGTCKGSADVYSLGAVYFRLLTGSAPFAADTSLQLLHKHVNERPPDPRTVDPSLPAACCECVARCMAKDPAQRPKPAALVRELDALLAELPMPIERPIEKSVKRSSHTSGIRAPKSGGRPIENAGVSTASSRNLPMPGAKRKPSSVWVAWAFAGVTIAAVTGVGTVVMRSRGDDGPKAPAKKPADEAPEVEPTTRSTPPDETGGSAAVVTPPPDNSVSPAAAEFEPLYSDLLDSDAKGDLKILEAVIIKLKAFHEKYRNSASPREREFADQALAVITPKQERVLLMKDLPPQGGPTVALFEDNVDLLARQLRDGDPVAADPTDRFRGANSIRVRAVQRHHNAIPGWGYRIVENPAAGEYRYIRFAWKKVGGTGIMVQLAHDGHWAKRYHSGPNTVTWESKPLAPEPPKEWTVVTRDLFADWGAFTVTGIALTAMDGEALFDQIHLGRTVEELDKLEGK